MTFYVNHLPDDSHEMFLFSLKKKIKNKIMVSARIWFLTSRVNVLIVKKKKKKKIPNILQIIKAFINVFRSEFSVRNPIHLYSKFQFCFVLLFTTNLN